MADAPYLQLTSTPVRDLDLYCAIVGAGASGSEAVTFVAIGLAESGGSATAISPLASDHSRGYGLWQIEWPTHADLFPGQVVTNGGWIYPDTNAGMAMSVYKSQGFEAWTTYKTGAYLAFMARAMESVAATAAGAKAHGMTLAAYIAGVNKANRVNFTLVIAEIGLGTTLGNAAAGAANSAAGDANAITGLYQTYSGPEAGNPLLRILEIVLGAALLVAGLKALTAPVTAPLSKAASSVAKLAR